MASLFNTRISDTYSGLIKTIDNAALTASLKELTDGSGLSTGVYMNTAGDFKVTAILEFGSLKDTGENIIISKFVDAADGIGNNDNDTTIPTTAAIIDYVAAQITIEDLDFTGDTGSGQIDLDSQIFAIGGTTNEITTVASGQSITFSLDSTGVNLPDNSTAITQTAGDNSTKIATTSYVDTLDAASDLDFSGDSGTGDVNLNTQTFAITGTANQIESSASAQGLSLQFPSAGVTLPNGSVATTQSAGDNSTKVATTSYVDTLDAASDLDITDGTNTGDVNLNTQSLSILGTTNEIDSVVSGQSVTLGLPNQINVNVQGNLTGNVTGDVTGDLTGNSAGTHTGAVIGNVTGNVTGNVIGDLTGNADTATAWQTARDLSLTGQATGTISSVDGTNNVSGSVTLDNNSVTGKVLTGLTSPSASSVLATDTIVEGFGKLQSQVNGLAGGLRFIGSWDADTNSPVLSDGGGEAANGTTTSTSANKLVDSSASFTSTVTVGDKVVNQVDGQTALVSNVDSDTTLSLDNDIMLSGEAYTIDNSPFITQGHYYVVSVGGTTSLNGVSNWTVGDWVIAGANNQWTKLDHSQVDGTGTTGNLTKWSSTSVISDSIVSESGTAITVDGSLTTNTNLSSTGNFAVNTDKFTVAAASGETNIKADVSAFGEIKSYYNGANYSRLLSGVDGGSVSGFNSSGGSFIIRDHSYSQIVSDGNFGIGIGGASAIQKVHIQGTGTTYMHIGNDTTGSLGTDGADIGFFTGQSDLQILNRESASVIISTNDTPALTLDSSQNATFAGAVNVTGSADLSGNLNIFTTGYPLIDLGTSATNYFRIVYDNPNDRLQIGKNNASSILLDGSGNATFAGNVGIGTDSPDAKLEIKGRSDSSDITMRFTDTDGSVVVGQDHSNIEYYTTDGATVGAEVKTIYADVLGGLNYSISTKTGGGSLTEKMRIDSSGKVIINDNTIGDKLLLAGDDAGTARGLMFNCSTTTNQGDTWDIDAQSSTGIIKFSTSSTERMRIDSSGNVGIGTDDPDYLLDLLKTAVSVDTYSGINLQASNYGYTIEGGLTQNVGGELIFSSNNAGTRNPRVKFAANGNVGIGTDSPDEKLHVANGDIYLQSEYNATGITDSFLYIQTRQSGNWRNSYIGQTGNNLIFGTGGTGTTHTNATERMRITSGGDVNIFNNSSYTRINVNNKKGSAGGTSGIQFGLDDGGFVTPDAARIEAKIITNPYSALDFKLYGVGGLSNIMTLEGNGNVLFGTTGLPNGTSIYGSAFHKSTVDRMILRMASSITGAAGLIDFFNPNGQVGYIATNGTATQYVTSSDYRLKEDLQDFNGLDKVSKIPVYDFKWKTDESRSYGVMAHELQEVLPDAVNGEKDAINEDGSIEPQGVDYSKIVPLLVKSIQELKAEVDKLKQECKCKN